MKPHNFLKPLLASTLLSSLVLLAGISHADDTEIFFGGPTIDNIVRPNVLFILDNSGSMNWRLDSNNTASGSQKSRLMVLKDSFADILNNTSDVNIGVMVLNSRSEYGSSRYMFPVRYIDDTLGNDSDLAAGTPGILQSADDATQAITPAGDAVIDSPTLLMGTTAQTGNRPWTIRDELTTTGSFFRQAVTQSKVTTDYACRLSPPSRSNPKNCTNGEQSDIDLRRSANAQALFHFKELNLPAGATITNAYIEVTPTNTPSSSSRRNLKLDVVVENSKTPAALNDNSPIGDRNYQDTAVVQVNGWVDGQRIAIDLLDQVTALAAAAPTQDPVQGLFVRFSGNSNNNKSQTYTFCANNCPDGEAPTLVIEYSAPASAGATEKRMAALRFQEIGIPQGATVTSARIGFVPAANNSDPVTFQIKAEKVGDASAFVADSDLTARSKTTAVSTWEAEPWVQDSPPTLVEGPDVTQLVQEVVNLSGWCGNNAMAFYLTPTSGSGLRSAQSFDGAGGLQPVLNVSYTGGEEGCMQDIVEVRIGEQKNDAYQNNGGTVTLGDSQLPLSRNRIGARFDDLPISRGAEVVEAKVIMTPANTVTNPSQTARISFQNSTSASAFSATSSNLSSSRSLTSEVSCVIDSGTGWRAGVPITCDISPLSDALTTIFASSSWNRGNALNLFIRQTSDTDLKVTAYESNPAQSIKLRLKLKNSGSSTTVRQHLNALVQNMVANDSTPIVPTMYDAAKYYRGDISGRASPINSACQANHLVLLTDGQANGNTATSNIASLIGSSCTGDSTDGDEQCARSLAKWIAENDQSSTIEGNNLVTTHTVGFALDASGTTTSNKVKTFLREVAEHGGGSFNTAENAAELSAVFNRILQEVLATDTTFVNASAPINSFNRQDNKDQLYFSLFRPSDRDRWSGNLKRYRMRIEDGEATIIDADGVPAIDTNTGFFRSDARSFWTTTRDGSSVTLGGAAHKLPQPANRNLYTYYGNSPTSAVNLSGYPITVDNTQLTAERLGVSEDAREELIDYIRGLDSDGNTRNGLGDPIHSSPRLVTYACERFTNGICTDEDQSAIIGSNEGFIHLFDTDTGVEQFAFMPEALLPNIKQLQTDTKTTSQKPRRYGMDNTVTVWSNDANNNGVIYGGKDPETGNPITGKNSGEFVYAYATMGRGGRNIYALDITSRGSPKLLWQILGGTTSGFEHLGQTWSAPVKTRIQIGNETVPRDVLIFGGGYDTNQDGLNQTNSTRNADSMGNALYIVDAKTGAKIWSAGNDNTHNLILPKMKYSIPSKVRVIDIQAKSPDQVDEDSGRLTDGGALVIDAAQLADQIFVGDMGGQVWRFFINHGNSGANLITAGGSNGDGVFASVAANTPASARRFYHEPDVALLKVSNTPILTVNIGSGYRGHPLNKTIEDRFYSFRTDILFKNGSEGTLLEDHMYDATENLIETGSDTEKAQAETAFSETHGGWYITLQGDGEKVLSRALTAGGALYFNTYEPSTSNAACSASIGQNRSYAVRLLNATPSSVQELDGTGTHEDRYQDSKSGGISGDPQLYCQGNDCFVLPSAGDAPIPIRTPPLGKTYWIDEVKDENN